ncbi:jg2079, partial [Pararge aegeria aegeria]
MTMTEAYRAPQSWLSLYHESDYPPVTVEKLNVTETSLEYVPGSYDDWTNGIRQISQSELKNKTYEILLKIARKGIDADNIVRNASLIHSLDFVDLLNTISILSYKSLVKLFDGLVLGTSYDLETARNIFLEVLPHARSDDCVRLIRHLVVEER